jgi:hypothetical protein
MKDIETEIKSEIYKYVNTLDLSEEEIKVIDDYVILLIENFQSLIAAQKRVFDDEKQLEILKKLIIESLGELNIG